jgi:hypothetical protein
MECWNHTVESVTPALQYFNYHAAVDEGRCRSEKEPSQTGHGFSCAVFQVKRER